MTLSSLLNNYGRKGISDILRYYVKTYPANRKQHDKMVKEIADDLQSALTNYQKSLEYDETDIEKDEYEEEEE